jgi:SAM-dependent methyltransferase
MSAARNGWLDHPLVAAHYRQRGAIDGVPWERWATDRPGQPAARSLEILCGSGARSFYLFEAGFVRAIDGIDTSEDAVLAGEDSRERCGAPGRFWVADPNSASWARGAYDLIVASPGLHHVVALEHLFDRVLDALAPGGVFVLEGYVGPSRFQWTEPQLAMTALAASWLPERLRMFRWGVPKIVEGRADRADVRTASPLGAIRSAEIVPLFRQRFATVAERRLGGTVQHLLYNGIMHNFADDDSEACAHLERGWQFEDALIDAGLLPSDFRLLVGRRR